MNLRDLCHPTQTLPSPINENPRPISANEIEKRTDAPSAFGRHDPHFAHLAPPVFAAAGFGSGLPPMPMRQNASAEPPGISSLAVGTGLMFNGQLEAAKKEKALSLHNMPAPEHPAYQVYMQNAQLSRTAEILAQHEPRYNSISAQQLMKVIELSRALHEEAMRQMHSPSTLTAEADLQSMQDTSAQLFAILNKSFVSTLGSPALSHASSPAGEDIAEIRQKRQSLVSSGSHADSVLAGPKRRKRTNNNSDPNQIRRCHSCHVTETPEWRRGPDGQRTLCNACGLHYAKLVRQKKKQQLDLASKEPKPSGAMSLLALASATVSMSSAASPNQSPVETTPSETAPTPSANAATDSALRN